MKFAHRLAACLIVLLLSLPALAQRPGATTPATQLPDASQESDRPIRPGDRALEDMLKDNEKKLNKQRQQDLKRDSDKLFDLATELKKYVDKSNENVLSLEVLRKAEEIERLARSVKDKMKGQ